MHKTTKFGGFANGGEQKAALVKAIEESKRKYQDFFNKTPYLRLSAERQSALPAIQARTRKEFTGQSEDLIKFAQTTNLNLLSLGQAVQDASTANKVLSEKLDIERQLREKAISNGSTEKDTTALTTKLKEQLEKASLQIGVGSGVIVASVAGLLFYFLVVRRN